MNLTERIESVILSNLQSPKERKIGIECEGCFYDSDLRRIPTNPADRFSATDLMNEMMDLQSNDEIKAGYSLEPGGQLEWASPPMKSLYEINRQFIQHKVRVSKIVKREKLKIVDYSIEPLYTPPEIELINNEKYRLMDQLFSKTGNLGQWMMRNTSSIQINIDFSSQEEAERMAYIADCLSPIASILFANSPFWKGKSGGNQNLRYKIWSNTDNSRCGNLLDHTITAPNGLVKKYAQYIQLVPAIFIEDKKGNVISYNNTLGTWLKELFYQDKLTDRHIQIALHQIFTHVRFKNVLEIRGSDRPPTGFELAPVAFWTGLLLEDKTQNEIFNVVKTWTVKERKKLNLSAYKLDLEQSGPDNKSIGEWIERVSDLSLKGLGRRSKKYCIENEESFLKEYLNVFNKKGIIALYVQKELKKSGKTVKGFI
jgi:glutamate--cysteine ligase